MKARQLTVVTIALLGFLLALPCNPTTSYASELEQFPIEAEVSYEPATEAFFAQARSWYGTSFSFTAKHYSSTHYFDGNNVGIEMNCSAPRSGSFSVHLYRGGSLVGTAQLNRNGFAKADWTNVGPGNYTFHFIKANDGTTVSCSNVAMYSW